MITWQGPVTRTFRYLPARGRGSRDIKATWRHGIGGDFIFPSPLFVPTRKSVSRRRRRRSSKERKLRALHELLSVLGLKHSGEHFLFDRKRLERKVFPRREGGMHERDGIAPEKGERDDSHRFSVPSSFFLPVKCRFRGSGNDGKYIFSSTCFTTTFPLNFLSSSHFSYFHRKADPSRS